MGIIKLILFVLNVIGWLVADIYLWTISWYCGIGGIVGLIAFFIGYTISGGMTVAPRDYWRLPAYEVFKKKIRYGNSIAGSVAVIAVIVLYLVKSLIES